MQIVLGKFQSRYGVFILLVIGMFLSPITVSAEGIFLNDGRVVYGRIISQDDKNMQVRTSFGVVNLKKQDIRKIDYELGLGQVTVVIKSGELVTGSLISITATKVIVKDENIEKDIPRTEIENLVLQKFDGRRDNIVGLTGGFIKTVKSLKEQVPYGYVDLSAFYLRTSASLPFFVWGGSASYIRLSTSNSKTKLKNAQMSLYPMMIDLRMKYPLLSKVSTSVWVSKIDFFATCGGGISYVTLTDGQEKRTGTYFTVQPGVGISMNIDDRFFLSNQYDYLYIHEKECSYSGVRVRIGVGYIF
ncbi:MAG TPA: hypothetical protein VF857_10965 [Spirochaetota bacterium]